MVSFDDPRGKRTNSDLETSAGIIAKDVLAQEVNLQEANINPGTSDLPSDIQKVLRSHSLWVDSFGADGERAVEVERGELDVA